jgi:hypothetical protein
MRSLLLFRPRKPQVVLLALLGLLAHTAAHADPLTALGLSRVMPLLLGLVAGALLILVPGLVVVIKDYRQQRRPRALTLLLLGLGLIYGALVGRVFAQLGSRYWPNLLTELYVPGVGLLLALAQLRGSTTRRAALGWYGGVSACALVVFQAVAGLLVGPARPIGNSAAPALYVLALVGLWLALALRCNRQLPPATATDRGSRLRVALVGPGLAAGYAVLLLLLSSILNRLFAPAPQPMLSAFVSGLLVQSVLATVFGLLALQVVSEKDDSQVVS